MAEDKGPVSGPCECGKFRKMLEIYCVARQLLAFQGLCSMKLDGRIVLDMTPCENYDHQDDQNSG
jgi:hypothetical protein